MSQQQLYHAHVYYGAATLGKARGVCEAARDAFGLVMGRMHEKPVGPHPDWSCQLLVPHDKFGDVVRWFMLNRDGLNVLIHPETGDHLKDHTEHAVWMGAVRPLDVSMFKTA